MSYAASDSATEVAAVGDYMVHAFGRVSGSIVSIPREITHGGRPAGRAAALGDRSVLNSSYLTAVRHGPSRRPTSVGANDGDR